MGRHCNPGLFVEKEKERLFHVSTTTIKLVYVGSQPPQNVLPLLELYNVFPTTRRMLERDALSAMAQATTFYINQKGYR
jgi:hypothetical protein